MARNLEVPGRLGMKVSPSKLPPSDTVAWRSLGQVAWLIPFFVLTAALQWRARDLPFWGDSLGYMIRNTVWMLEHGSAFQPPDHDTGHPPLAFWTLAGAWSIFGRSLFVSHAVQWFWFAVLLGGVYRFTHSLTGGRSILAGVAVAWTALHPVFRSSAGQLTPDVAMLGLFVWMLWAFYTRRKGSYIAFLALTLLTKANAFPLIVIFGVVEFFLLPGWLAWRHRRRRRALRVIGRWWVRWSNASLLGGVPVLLWLAIHKAVNGYWFASPLFSTSFQMNFSPRNLAHMFATHTRWLLWHREGHTDVLLVLLAAMGATAFLVFRRRKAAPVSLRPYWRRYGMLRPPSGVLISFGLQVFALIIVYTAKDLRLLRFLMPAMLMYLLGTVVVLDRLARISLIVAPRQAVQGTLAILLLFVAVSFAIRWDPGMADRLLLPGFAREYFRNANAMGYDHNAQLASILRINRWAVRDLEQRYFRGGAQARIVAQYPFDVALEYAEGGYLSKDRAVPVFNLFLEEDFEREDWDYYLHSPLNFNTGGLTEKRLAELGAALPPVESYTYEDTPWGYVVRLFRHETYEP